MPERVVELAKSQVLSQLAAARATLGHSFGRKIVTAFGLPTQADPARAAFVLAALTVALDFDDTVYAGHVSHSTVGVPLAYAGPLELDGRGLLASVIAANECAARVTAAATLGRFRGQTAAHAHLAGAVAGRLRAEGASADRFVDAWGLAFGMPPWTLMPAFLGSDAKVLTAAVPVRMALDACDAAAAGLHGRDDILERDGGLVSTFAQVPLPEALTAGLGPADAAGPAEQSGVRWHTETLSFKAYPACAYLGAALDCAVGLHEDLAEAGGGDVGAGASLVEEVVVHASLFTLGMDMQSAPFVEGPGSPVSALEFSAGYPVAAALLTGALQPGDLDSAAASEPRRWELARRVRVEHDPELTRAAALATAPIGEALRLAGPRAADWLALLGEGGGLAEELGRPADSFENASKAIGARVEVVLSDGRRLVRSSATPAGSAGASSGESHQALVRSKFLASGGSEQVAGEVARLDELDAPDVAGLLAAALKGA